MNPRLVEYYNRELTYLRELGAEFAAAFPKVAGRLSLREIEVADPYVERLLEGFSFLTARIQMKMDAEFPRLSQRILEMVCPHYLAPTPSMLVAQIIPSAFEGNIADGYTLEAGSELRATRMGGENTTCIFTTGHAVTLWPIQLVQAKLAGVPVHLPLARFQLQHEPAGHLRLDLVVEGGIHFEHLKADKLDCYISATDEVASHLQELIHESLLGIVVHDTTDATKVYGYLPPSALKAEGYEQNQALLPYSNRGFQGHRLLHEFFAMPARFRFFSINGLRAVLAQVSGKAVTLSLLLRKAQPRLEPLIDAQKILLHCVPAINLFEYRADRVHLSSSVNEYHVVPDRSHPRDYEVYAVTGVTGHQDGEINEREFVPLYSGIHGIRPEHQAYYALRREPRLFSDTAIRSGPRTQYMGSEVFISLVDQLAPPFADSLKQLTIKTLCSNRDLPLLMGVNGKDGDLVAQESAPVAMIRVVAGPTRPTASVAENEITWRLISHLSLNYLAMTDLSEEEGAATLRELMGLYRDLGDSELSGQIAGIKQMQIGAVTRRLEQQQQLLYGRGVQVGLTVDESAFAGVSPWPMAAVLERFFARHVGINSFTELVLHSQQRGRVAQWAPRPGQRPSV